MTLKLTDDICNKALYYLQSILNRYERNLSEFSNMLIPTISSNNKQNTNHLIREEQQYDIEEFAKFTENNISQLNIDQQTAFKKIITAIENKTFVIFFIDSPGRTEKIFLYK